MKQKNMMDVIHILDLILIKMSTKNELHLMLKTFGYDLNPNTSKDTLVNLLHLHSKVREMKNINI